MQALGLIETKGLIPAIESADAMLKAADVTLIEKTNVGGGLVSILVSGEVSSVKAAVDAGAAAVEQINSELLVSQHVIPRPDEELKALLKAVKPPEIVKTNQVVTEKANSDDRKASKGTDCLQILPENIVKLEDSVNRKEEVELSKKIKMEQVQDSIEWNLETMDKKQLDKIVQDNGLEKALEILNQLRVTKLRSLAREYKDLGMVGRVISKANKKALLVSFKEYYERT